ncbi:MAG: hypothetical protein ACRDRU_21680 [Pseudonocardiaceae bacterium]
MEEIIQCMVEEGVVNLVELAAAEMIDWLLSVGEGLGLVVAGVPSYAGFRWRRPSVRFV